MPTLPPPPSLHADAVAAAPPGVRGRMPFATVQLGAYASRSDADAVLEGLRGRLPAGPPAPLHVQAARVQGRRWFRVMAGPLPADAAQALCRALSGRGAGCLVRPEPVVWREALRTR